MASKKDQRNSPVVFPVSKLPVPLTFWGNFTMLHPLRSLIQTRGAVVIDGAMSTALEKLGCDLNHRLWSARVLAEDPDKIRTVHTQYFEAGADVAITASYQATAAGFAAAGIDKTEAARLIGLSVTLAQEARTAYLKAHPGRTLLIAGAVGPYGAYLADGSEYTGRYHLTADEYREFHRVRLDALKAAGADLIAIETQPKLEEVAVLLKMLEERNLSAWVTFTLADEGHLPDGTPVEEAARLCATSAAVDALGLNCVKRELAAGALKRMAAVTDLPLILYPNSGETYDAATKTWHHPVGGPGWHHFVAPWKSLGVKCLGGCCRTLPADIVEIARLMKAEA